mmetsp:Transcript_108352/g.324040  ORF Transcript_108352/g.324040 Transcript_108352/m.324040 type:complete len:254 (-) Transcript_108352:916-1677(-)
MQGLGEEGAHRGLVMELLLDGLEKTRVRLPQVPVHVFRPLEVLVAHAAPELPLGGLLRFLLAQELRPHGNLLLAALQSRGALELRGRHEAPQALLVCLGPVSLLDRLVSSAIAHESGTTAVGEVPRVVAPEGRVEAEVVHAPEVQHLQVQLRRRGAPAGEEGLRGLRPHAHERVEPPHDLRRQLRVSLQAARARHLRRHDERAEVGRRVEEAHLQRLALHRRHLREHLEGRVRLLCRGKPSPQCARGVHGGRL